jgi:hypothetical protein
MDLEMMIQKIASATFVTEASVGAAKKVANDISLSTMRTRKIFMKGEPWQSHES